MTDNQFYTAFGAALTSSDRLAYVSDLSNSSLFREGDTTDQELGEVWDVAHATIADIRAHTGLGRTAFARRYCIPVTSLVGWETGRRKCPDYLRLLLAEASGAYQR